MSDIKICDQTIDDLKEKILATQVLGIGTGRTVEACLLRLWNDQEIQNHLKEINCVSSSQRTTLFIQKITQDKLELVNHNLSDRIDMYLDGADVINHQGLTLKGLGGAMVFEKVLAYQAKLFYCVIQPSKFGHFTFDHILPIAVIPSARSSVARHILTELPECIMNYRVGSITDEGCHIIDLQGLDFQKPLALEAFLNNIPGCVGHGLFAKRIPNGVWLDNGVTTTKMDFH
ncbi:MAG: ribose-5-phosphate isomerase A [Candidatus Comchoanobacterales bacterium]